MRGDRFGEVGLSAKNTSVVVATIFRLIWYVGSIGIDELVVVVLQVWGVGSAQGSESGRL